MAIKIETSGISLDTDDKHVIVRVGGSAVMRLSPGLADSLAVELHCAASDVRDRTDLQPTEMKR